MTPSPFPNSRVKRAGDIILSVTMLVLTSPLLAIVALLVRASSPGPVVFRSQRVGLYGQAFEILKFRSMHVDQERRLADRNLADKGENGQPLLHRHDPRITPVGRWLRLTSLDELPQLVNILRGEMSLVGPRPVVSSMVDQDDPFASARASLRPGLTGLWQVRNRADNVVWADMRDDDMEYVRRASLAVDLLILLLTPSKMILLPGPTRGSAAAPT